MQNQRKLNQISIFNDYNRFAGEHKKLVMLATTAARPLSSATESSPLAHVRQVGNTTAIAIGLEFTALQMALDAEKFPHETTAARSKPPRIDRYSQITAESVEVLRILHSHSSIRKIRT